MLYAVVKKSLLVLVLVTLSLSVFANYPYGHWDGGYIHEHPQPYSHPDYYIEGGGSYWHGHHYYPHRYKHYRHRPCQYIKKCYGYRCFVVRHCYNYW